MVQPDAYLQVADRVLDLGVAALSLMNGCIEEREHAPDPGGHRERRVIAARARIV